ncbi:MAG: 50S ribosomal protein L18Ae [Candidatus Bathyarchaeia archaeon]
MSEVKTLRVTGVMKGSFRPLKFTKEVRTLNEEAAREKVYTEIGSKHKLKRFQIEIHSVEEVDFRTVKNQLTAKLAESG